MAVFPDILSGIRDFQVENIQEIASLGPTATNRYQRRWKWAGHRFRIAWQGMQSTDAETLWNFYQARQGGWESFSLFEYKLFPYTSVSLGTKASSAASTFALIAKNVHSSSLTVRIGGTTVASTLSTASGTDGQDQIIISSTTTGAVTASYIGRKYHTGCVFEDRGLSRSVFMHLFHESAVSIVTTT